MVKNWIILGDAAFDADHEPIGSISIDQEEMPNWAEHSLHIIESAKTEKISNWAKENGAVWITGIFGSKNHVSNTDLENFSKKVADLFSIPLAHCEMSNYRGKGGGYILISFSPPLDKLIEITKVSTHKCTIMSLHRTETITCPNCNKTSTVIIRDSLNVTLEQDEKDKLLNGELFQWECPHCHESYPLDYSFLYHDMEKHLMIFYAPAKDDSAIDEDEILLNSTVMNSIKDSCTFRTVHGKENLKEKISIFDAGLNDVTIEYFKLFGTIDADEERRFTFYFDRMEEDQLVFHCVDIENKEEKECNFPYAEYLKYEEKVNSHEEFHVPQGIYVEINRNWLVRQIGRIIGC